MPGRALDTKNSKDKQGWNACWNQSRQSGAGWKGNTAQIDEGKTRRHRWNTHGDHKQQEEEVDVTRTPGETRLSK